MPAEKKEIFKEIYEKNFSYVYNIVYALVVNRENAEDITADVFVKALDGYERFDPRKASVRTWLCSIAKNMVIDRWRTHPARRQDICIDSVEEPSFEEEPEVFRDETNRMVAGLLRRLSAGERDLIVMRYFMEMTNPEIGARLNISPKSVCERFRRLLEKCRRLLRGKEFGADSGRI